MYIPEPVILFTVYFGRPIAIGPDPRPTTQRRMRQESRRGAAADQAGDPD